MAWAGTRLVERQRPERPAALRGEAVAATAAMSPGQPVALQGEVAAATAAMSPEVEAWLGKVEPGEQRAPAASQVVAVLEAPGASPMELPVEAARARSTTEALSMAQAHALPQT